MEFLNIPLFDYDFYKMIFRFVLNMFFLTVIIRYLYYNNNKKIAYLFTYYMIGVIVFFLCFTLKKYDLDLGMALGLFAIFGIIRYRTNAIEIKEMTYLFVIIGVSVINSLANKKMSYSELLAANILIVIVLAIIEKQWSKQVVDNTNVHDGFLKNEIVYNSIENISETNRLVLKKELEDKLGISIQTIRVGKIDFFKNTVQLTIEYKSEMGN